MGCTNHIFENSLPWTFKIHQDDKRVDRVSGFQRLKNFDSSIPTSTHRKHSGHNENHVA